MPRYATGTRRCNTSSPVTGYENIIRIVSLQLVNVSSLSWTSTRIHTLYSCSKPDFVAMVCQIAATSIVPSHLVFSNQRNLLVATLPKRGLTGSESSNMLILQDNQDLFQNKWHEYDLSFQSHHWVRATVPLKQSS